MDVVDLVAPLIGALFWTFILREVFFQDDESVNSLAWSAWWYVPILFFVGGLSFETAEDWGTAMFMAVLNAFAWRVEWESCL